MAEVKKIWIKRFKRGPMDPVEAATLVTQQGIEGNADQGLNRQITIIEEEVWKGLMHQIDGDLDPSERRANLMIAGLSLKDSRKKVLKVGDCRILIKGETKPCERMDEAKDGLQDLMRPEWRGGAYGRILEGGTIKLGDPVSWEVEEG